MRALFWLVSSVSLLCTGCAVSPSHDEPLATAEQACPVICDGHISRTTPIYGTSSFDCATSTAGLNTVLGNAATDDCANLGYDVDCGVIVTITQSCFPVETSVQINGYASYRCGRITC